MAHTEDIRQWLKIVRADGVGSVTFSKLIDKFQTTDQILGCSVMELTKIDGIGTVTAEKIVRTRDIFDPEPEIELADKLGIDIISLNDSRYPPLLKRIYDPPPVLYVKGSFQRADNLAIAIVGSRRCSHYGSEQASRFAHLLAVSGFTIVSGMARGIDSNAHMGSLSAGGRTIAVQGCGLAKLFPPENKNLFDQICTSGGCVSELPLQTEPRSENFPPRNRIIAGLTLGTIVIEAFTRSGALITAKAALDYDRQVMAIPGKIDSPLSAGPNKLIKDGAKLVTSPEDIAEALGYIGQSLSKHITDSSTKAAKKIEHQLFDTAKLKLSQNESTIFETLNNDPTHLEHIIERTLLEPGAINASLISLNLKGLIKQLEGDYFIKR